MEMNEKSKLIFKLLNEGKNMNQLKFVNKKLTLEELKEVLNKGDRQKYKLVRYYDRTYTKKCFNGQTITSDFGDYVSEYFYGYPDKYLNLPVISYMIKNDLITILVYGGKRSWVV